MVSYIDDCIEQKGLDIQVASAELNILHYYYTHWKKILSNVSEMEKSEDLIPHNISGDSHSIHPGCASSLDVVQEGWMCTIFKLQGQGLPIKSCTIGYKASSFSCNFKEKLTKAKKACVLYFGKKIGLTHHARTQVAQKDYKESVEEAKHFMVMMHRKMAQMDPIISKNHISILYFNHSNPTLENREQRQSLSIVHC